MKRGDMVAYVPRVGPKRNRTVYAKVLRWSGDPDSRALLIDTEGRTYRCYSDSVQLLEGNVGRDFQLEIDCYLESKSGKQALRDASAPVTVYEDANGRRRAATSAVKPDSSPGSPDPGQVPVRVVRGMSGELNKAATRVVCIGPTERQSMTRGADRALGRDPTLRYRLPSGELLTDALRRLGMDVPTPTQIRQRAQAILEFSRAALGATPHNEGRETEAKSDALTSTREALRSAACRP